ncbi:hypothetical protein [Sporomusa sp. KB1]|uniref:hypothetical protein n=1 Tax=Sporomusa sp. KB1 TaxID=943346 RepID=UPI001C9626C4|nr:hypothetical protein [Sporomusa sp. KB1]
MAFENTAAILWQKKTIPINGSKITGILISAHIILLMIYSLELNVEAMIFFQLKRLNIRIGYISLHHLFY